MSSPGRSWGRFKKTPPKNGRLFMLSWDRLVNMYHGTSAFHYDTIIALKDSINGMFEDREVCSFTKASLERLLDEMGYVVTERYGSSVQRVEYVKISHKPDLPAAVRRTLSNADALPKYPFEVLSFEGGRQHTFAYIASRILGPVLKKKIVLSVPHKRSEAYSPRGAFQIYIWSTPNRGLDASIRPPNRIWGIQTRCRDRVFQPTGTSREGSVLISDGDYVVAELFENALYVHHDLVHFGADQEFELFAKLLEKVARALMGGEKWEALNAKAKEEFLKQQQKTFAQFVRKGIPRRAFRHKASLDAARTKAEEALQSYFEAERDVFRIGQSVTNPKVAVAKFEKEFSLLQSGSLEGVNSIILEGSGDNPVITISTKELTTFNHRTKKTHLLGHFEISFYLESGSVRFHNLDRNIRGFEGQIQPAPHVYQSGTPCLGNIESELHTYIAHYEIEAAIAMSMAFLQTGVNNEDPLGRIISSFPELTREEKEAMAA